MRNKKILLQFLAALLFFWITAHYANNILSNSALELNLMFDFLAEAAQRFGINLTISLGIKEYINARTMLLTDIWIGIEYLLLFLITARKTIKYRQKIKNPKKTKGNHMRAMVIIVVLFVLVQMTFLNVRRFNSGSIITIESFYIPGIMLLSGLFLAALYAGKKIGVHYVLPKKARTGQ